jgi:hypothetical protein
LPAIRPGCPEPITTIVPLPRDLEESTRRY